jgi:arylesterase / paraoxonase
MKTFKRILLLILIIIIAFVVKTLFQAGTFKDIYPHFEGKIKEVSGVIAVEDITIDKSTGIAILSSSERNLKGKLKRGDVFILNLNNENAKPINLTSALEMPDFRPHGISLYQSPQGEKRLFVVNHRDIGNFIEVFKFTDSTLVLLESFSNELIISPNDVHGVGLRQFYVTNDHNQLKSTSRNIKDYLQIGMGNVVFYDGYEFLLQDDGLKYANGINQSKDGKYIFVATTTGRTLMVYERNKDGLLKKYDEIETETGIDNIEVDESGSLWIGSHPQLLKFTAHAKDNSKPSPSQVIKIDYLNKGNYIQKEVYLNDGKPASGSSVGAIWKDNLLIGTVFEPKILWGKIKK